MPGVTEQEIAQAKQMNLYQYMQLCEPDNFKPEGPGQFRHKGHSSLTFAEDGSWTYFKTKATGRTALNYLIAVEGVSFVEAVQEINRIQGGVRPSFQPVKTPPPPAEKKPAKEFRLPRPDKNNYAATAYLRKRCIHPNVLTVCKQKRILYQTSFKDHPNCVFVGRDGNGEPKGGSLRGCSKIQFRRDIPGSKKIYPFYIEAAANADTVEVYEAPIYTLADSSWYESVTGQQRHYTLQPLETPPENYEPEPAQVGAYLTAPVGFSQHVIVYLQNLYTDDVYDLELYESNGLAAVEPNALSGKYAFLSAYVVGDAEIRYQFSCEQNELSTETGADFHLTVTDTASPDREMNTPSRDQNSTVQAANSFNNRNTDAPQQSTTQPEIVSQSVKQQKKQLDLLSLLLDFMPVVLVGAVLFAVRRKRRH